MRKQFTLLDEFEPEELIRRRKSLIGLPASVSLSKGGKYGVGATVNSSKGGIYSVSSSTVGYNVYVGIDAIPDLDTPTQFSATLPITVITTPPGSGTKTYNVIVRAVNAYGLESQNQKSYSFTINSSGTLLYPTIDPPQQLAAMLDKYSAVRILAVYPNYPNDVYPATLWKLWISLAVPDVDVDAVYQTGTVDSKYLRPILTGTLPSGTYNVALCLYRDSDATRSEPARTTVIVPAGLATPVGLP